MGFPLFRRKSPMGKDYDGMSEEYRKGLMEADEHYKDFVLWASAYIALLEKRLHGRDCEGCCQRQCSDNEGGNGEDEEKV